MAIQHEKVEQQHIVQLLKLVKAEVYVVGTRRPRGKKCPKCGTFVQEHQGTCQSAGIPDLLAFLPNHAISAGVRIAVFIECKAAGGRMSPEQKDFKALCLMAGMAHIVGTLDAVIAFLIGAGYMKADQFPHYRQPKASPSC